MTITKLFAGAALLAAFASPAVAAPDPRVEPVPAPTPAPVASPGDDQRRYCFQTEATGTRLLKKVCQTRAQWRIVGVDVDAQLKR